MACNRRDRLSGALVVFYDQVVAIEQADELDLRRERVVSGELAARAQEATHHALEELAARATCGAEDDDLDPERQCQTGHAEGGFRHVGKLTRRLFKAVFLSPGAEDRDAESLAKATRRAANEIGMRVSGAFVHA